MEQRLHGQIYMFIYHLPLW